MIGGNIDYSNMKQIKIKLATVLSHCFLKIKLKMIKILWQKSKFSSPHGGMKERWTERDKKPSPAPN